jgi:hypothetical protein
MCALCALELGSQTHEQHCISWLYYLHTLPQYNMNITTSVQKDSRLYEICPEYLVLYSRTVGRLGPTCFSIRTTEDSANFIII